MASYGARMAWSQEKPGSQWELLPHYCQVVQGRRAEYEGRGFLQVTTRMALEERWVASKTKTEELRVREHFVVFELPREGAIVQDFRIAAIELDAAPAKE
mmetsp:Transcript_24234/g.39483  ORF Transcript_24234/g.39483 Transcript_24234/m.39483 type:complete len:100 (+) Transcript_24234:3-302(+)